MRRIHCGGPPRAGGLPVTLDATYYQRPLAISAVDFAPGDADALPTDHNKFYGVAFEVLPLLVERIAGFDDTRRIFLTRHLMTHLLFIAGGFCCYLLAYRMTGSRLLGLFAMLLFLLHPRIYAHSFFNSKDIPFLSMLMIALLTVHWAFRKGTVGAFPLCGAAVGILVNLRIMGVMLLPAVLAMRACDVYYAAGWPERRWVIGSGAAFALAAAGIYYASLPYLWADSIGRFGDLLASLSYHPAQLTVYHLFQGKYVNVGEFPARYIPVWIGITTPPWALLVVLAGAVALTYRSVSGGVGAVLRNGGRRFELLTASCAALPIIAIISLQSVIYDDWRQLYFLWGPLCLLAALGLHQVGVVLGKALAPRPATLSRWALVGLATIAMASIVVQVIRLHPYQHLYFNSLVDRTTPEYLKTQYIIDYLSSAHYEGFKHILESHPDETINLETQGTHQFNILHLEIFPESVQRRFNFGGSFDADYYVFGAYTRELYHTGLADLLLPPTIYSKQMYNNTIMNVATPHLSRVDEATANAYRELYRTAVRGEPARSGWFDLYLDGKTLTLVNEDCQPGTLSSRFTLLVYPGDADDLPGWHRWSGHLTAWLYGVRFDGKCLMQAVLPDYDIARIVVSGVGEIVPADYLPKLRRQYAALQVTEPAIRSDFTVYAKDGALRYIKSECSSDNMAATFYLHIIPADVADLPAGQREHGFDNRDFNWGRLLNRGQAIAFDDKCMATVELPDYEIHGIRTGQFVPGEGRLWSGEFYRDAYYAAQAYELAARAAGTPAAQDFYRIYHDADALTYIREDCASADTDVAFYLHLVPADVAVLPAGQREHGFDNRDFEFDTAGGVRHEGRCLVSVPLPEYGIVGIRTGQYAADAGRLWGVEFGVGE